MCLGKVPLIYDIEHSYRTIALKKVVLHLASDHPDGMDGSLGGVKKAYVANNNSSGKGKKSLCRQIVNSSVTL